MSLSQDISIQEATRIIDSGAVFSCTVCSFDESRKKGGEWMEYPECRKLINKGRQKTAREQKKASFTERAFVRKIVILQDGFESSIIRTIHPDLLKVFNGRNVIA